MVLLLEFGCYIITRTKALRLWSPNIQQTYTPIRTSGVNAPYRY